MSLNSLQDDMSRRAASMAAMARRANNPQEIQAIQQSLVAGVQNGSIQPYVGIPLIQDLTKKLAEATAKMAQTVAGAGMPQPPADGPPIAQQVMQQAAQESQGVEALPSNLPQSYAGGGIIAFEGGGQVERYQNAGFTGGQEFGFSDPVAEAVDDLKYQEKARVEAIRNAEARAKFLREAGAPQAAEAEAKLAALKGPNPYDPAKATRRSQYTNTPIPNTPGAAAPAAAPSAAPGAAIPGAGNFQMPTLPSLTLPTGGPITSYKDMLENAPENAQKASEKAVKEAEKKYEGFDEPGNKAREEKLGKREAAQEKDSAMDRALNLMNLGFGIAGSREGTLAGALGKEGRQGITDLIKGEAANRAAKNKLDDLRDAFEQQKTAAKKGNYQAAQAAGERAADNARAYTQLNIQATHYGNAEANQRLQLEQQGVISKAQLEQQGILGLGKLDLDRRQLNQSAAASAATLAANEKRYAYMSEANRARIMQATAKGLNDFMQGEGGQLRAQLAKDYGANFMTANDARSLEARQIFNQRKQAYLADIRGQAIDALSARSADALLSD